VLTIFLPLCPPQQKKSYNAAGPPPPPLSTALSPPLPFVPVPSLPVTFGPPVPLPSSPPSPAPAFFPSLRAAPPRLSPLLVVGVVSPRLPFPSTIWMLIPPLLTISAQVFLSEGVFVRGWWVVFPLPPFFVVGVLLVVVAAHLLSAIAFLLFFCTGHHTATATPPLRLQQPAPKPSNFPSDSDSQHSFTYLCEFPESSTLISLIFVAKSEFSRVLAYPTTRNATKTSATPRPTAQTVWERVPSPCGPS
jgi:hypothetical protein